MGRLNQRVAIVTQARSGAGVGAGIAARLKNEGATVITVDAMPESKAAAERVAAAALADYGRIDILVNASDETAAFAPLESKTDAVAPDAQRVLWMMQAVYPAMRAQQSGRIVNLVATLGDSLNRQAADTVAASEAIKSLTRSAAEEWGQYNILVNALAPAADTENFRRLRLAAPEAVDALIAGTPMQRMGDPVDDIGGAVMLLIGEAGRFLTGHVLYADGGQHLTPTPYEALVPMH
ncbi:MAG: short-chain dehydrogenase/reductase [Hydrocarboniphaga sp.]|uniref:SDR family NAD(P)-dependent oxidoreductase n=1 Tax=Hydrocarboniphaga sp. TaxID=2033016 RepID=UPI002622DBAF|nr:SDR family oxidoreductase [Hydrocarboniphaga sp.]MDB5968001.1 short-chain dehydrogenase/reductase [Hydrocarboniphaga sp.]